jgi:Sulfotransferase domain
MMMRMLEAGGLPVLTDQSRKADSDNPAGYYEFQPAKQLQYNKSWLPEARGKVVKIVHRLLRQLPQNYDYRVIFMSRDIDEILASHSVMLQNQNKFEAGKENWAELFQKDLTELSALFYGRLDFAVLDVDYNSVIADPHDELREVKNFLGRPLDLEAMKAVVDVAWYRQRRANLSGDRAD